MSVLGAQIRKFRTAKGVTQEQLGQLVGVTTQAVSKWECGGTPDVELLPKLAQVLGVSIDALFGQEEQGLTHSLVKQLWKMEPEEAFRFAFEICWAMELGLMHDPVPDSYLASYLDTTSLHEEEHPSFARIMRDAGTATVRIAPDFQHFFLMKDPKSGLETQFSSIESLRRVFEVFSDETLLKVLFTMYTRLNTPVAASLISRNSGLSIDEVERYLDILCQHNLARRTAIATAAGDIYSYTFNQESGVIALLCYADELARRENQELLWSFSRTKPLFRSAPK